ncbi:hypothetical protein UC34_14580 [Pandoraea vervacti]|uniref:Uncharacterized protein n=1 Tax=Pandoraea vervacti TaxID=656178 RepID=A0ABN4FTB7_9BURK|nr:hypothetical protein UC34_14580 [Pandoraea vervacti]
MGLNTAALNTAPDPCGETVVANRRHKDGATRSRAALLTTSGTQPQRAPESACVNAALAACRRASILSA